jgi:hypothetical protein
MLRLRRLAAALALLVPAGAAVAAESGPVILLEVASRVGPEEVPEAAPPRFALFEDGQVFVGGSQELMAGRLEKGEAKAIESQIERIRKQPGLGSAVSFGPGERRARLQVRKGSLEIVATGDPDSAPIALRPLAGLIRTLETFSHPSLRPFRPASYSVRAREASLRGGCRGWDKGLPPLAELAGAPRVVAADLLWGWPTGAIPASVCDGERMYVVTFRPLLPGEPN